MALPSSNIWECRTTGSDTANSGGFDPSVTSPGTDFSQQDSAQVSYSDLVIGATTTNLTSAAHPFGATHVGNTIQITGGGGFTTGFYSVRSVSGVTATMDRAVGTAASTGGVGGLGGALASPGKAAGAYVGGNYVHIKSGTYTIANTTANTSGGPVNLSTAGASDAQVNRWVGYQTARGDLAGVVNPAAGARPVLQVAASGVTGVTVFNVSGHRTHVEAIEVDGQSKAGILGFSSSVTCRFLRCLARNCTTGGFNLSGNSAYFCRATGCSSLRAFTIQGALAYGCVADANSIYGFVLLTNGRAVGCVSANNTGANDGFYTSADGATAHNCLSYNNGGNGFMVDGTAAFHTNFTGCLSYGNAAFGFKANSSVQDNLMLLGCAAGGNTSGATNGNVTRTEGFVSLTADPFVDKTNGNFGLNSVGDAFGQTTGLTGVIAGRYLRGAGLGAFPGLPNTVGSPDVGAVQHADAGGGLLFGANWEGGYE